MTNRLVIAFALTAISQCHASPFVLQELVREGDILPGLAEPVFIIGVPSINSSGEWAVPVSSPAPNEPTFRSGVLGNHGFRVVPGFDPDGSPSAVRTRYDSASIRDDGTMALVTQRLLGGLPSELWFGGHLAATSPGAAFNRVALQNDDTLIGSISTGAGGFTVVAEPDGQGGWDSKLVHGFGTEIPVGTVLAASTHGRGYARSESGRQAWLGRIEAVGDRGVGVWSIASDNEFLIVDGQESKVPGYAYRPSGGGLAMQADGDLFFAVGLEWMGEGPSQFESGVFREDGSPIITSRDSIENLESLGVWGISGSSLRVDENDNILWTALSTHFPGPGDPYGVIRSALMYNDLVLAQTGDLLPDGSTLLGPTENFELSTDGNWAIATLWVRDPDLGDINAVYRIAIPTPGSSIAIIMCVVVARGRRRS